MRAGDLLSLWPPPRGVVSVSFTLGLAGLSCRLDKRVCGGPSCFASLQASTWAGKSTGEKGREGWQELHQPKMTSKPALRRLCMETRRAEVHF